MARRRFYRTASDRSAEINLAPLIDMIFILLIFFLVTTTFVSETGVTVNRPTAAVAENLAQDSVFIAVDGKGRIHMAGESVGLMSLRARVRRLIHRKQVPVVIIPDRAARASVIMDVLDECKLAGANSISLAAEKE